MIESTTPVKGPVWQVPRYRKELYKARSVDACVLIPVFNEGDRIKKVLERLQPFTDHVDVFVLDKGSTDGSLETAFLKRVNVRGLLTLQEDGRLSTQLRMGYAFALEDGYEKIITIDGNNKDEVEALPKFLAKLEEGYDLVQASRYLPGGAGVNTPFIRNVAVRLIHAPVISWLSGFRYTDTTQGYRGYSARLLRDERLAIFRDVFVSYELLGYLSVRAPRLGFKVTEIPVRRTYPKGKKVPTKISFIKGNLELLRVLLYLALNRYDPN